MKALFKFYFTCLLAIVFLTALTSCRESKKSYSFEQNIENMASVEICQYDLKTDAITPIVSLSETEYTELLSEISTLSIGRQFGDHLEGYGEIIVYITYQNQEAEIIGCVNTACVDVNGEHHKKNDHFYPDEWDSLLSKWKDRKTGDGSLSWGQGDGSIVP